MKLAIISHTQHYYNINNKIVGWGPTLTEINYLLNIFDEIYHIAVLCDELPPKSSIPYISNKIHFVPLKKVGGTSIKNKIELLLQIPDVLNKVQLTLKKVDYFQLRTPTGMGVYLIPYLTWFIKTKGWFKYAGNWNQKNAPWSFAFQRWMLKKQRRTVTINGKWECQPKNCISFENPCLNDSDRMNGLEIVNNKQLPSYKYNYCFVGGLNKNKGIDKLIKVFIKLKHQNLGTLHIVGDGVLKDQLSKELGLNDENIIFHGFLSKNKIQEIYKICHFIILPSKNEGFPKVIGEGMNYGCVPVVSKVSCIDQYIQNDYNGFLISPVTLKNIEKQLLQSLDISGKDYVKYIHRNYKLVNKFTFNYYINKIKSKVFEIE